MATLCQPSLISSFFQTAFAYFLSLCHVLITYGLLKGQMMVSIFFFSKKIFLIKVCTLFFRYSAISQLIHYIVQCKHNLSALRNQKIHATFIVTFVLLQWSGTKAIVSSRYACMWSFKDQRSKGRKEPGSLFPGGICRRLEHGLLVPKLL